MKLTVLVVLIVLPMLASIGLYGYAFLSKRWSYLDENFINQHNSSSKHRENDPSNKHIQLETHLIRHGFRSHYSLFGYCLDYKWLNLLTVKTSSNFDEISEGPYGKGNGSVFCPVCSSSSSSPSICPQTGCCMNLCNQIPDCPSYIDEKNCSRASNQKTSFWPEGNCIWKSTWIDLQNLFKSIFVPSKLSKTVKADSHISINRLHDAIMFLLFVAAPIFTCLALMILLCINCVERFYSIPFAFVSFFSLASFLSGAGGLGLFLYQWINDRLYRDETTYDYDQNEVFNMAFNPWIINAERLGLAFWMIVAAVSTNLFTTILSCCFCCGLQSEKSKLRIHVKNPKYEIVHMSAYDD